MELDTGAIESAIFEDDVLRLNQLVPGAYEGCAACIRLPDGDDALPYAIKSNAWKCVRTIVDRSSTTSIMGTYDRIVRRPPLHMIIAHHGPSDLFDAILAKTDPNQTDGFGQTALHAWALEVNTQPTLDRDPSATEKLIALLDTGADPDKTNRHGKKPVDLMQNWPEGAEALQKHRETMVATGQDPSSSNDGESRPIPFSNASF